MDKHFNEFGQASSENITTDNTELASRWSRLGAVIFDGLSVMPFSLIVIYFTGGFDDFPQLKEHSLSYSLSMSLASMAIFLIIHGKFILRDGQTLGKKLFKIKIVTCDGCHAEFSTLAKRYGFYWVIPQIPIFGPVINLVNIGFIFSHSKRCLHDRIAGTKVIKNNKN